MNRPGAERRRERRYQVELHGELRFDGKSVPVQIVDLSASGALVMATDPPAADELVDLWIEDFGLIQMDVMHASGSYCGLALANPAADRDELLEWLRQDADGAGLKRAQQ